MKQKLPYILIGALLAFIVMHLLRIGIWEMIIIAVVATALLYVWKMPGPRRK